ncbi:MAG TPA: hypothetical protein EYP85_14655 [Armatimonadetes bacterium]|nr:hypothetical protein [Armatimonadota bacterium]
MHWKAYIKAQNGTCGQALLLAVIVMLLIALAGGAFIALVARDISSTQRDVNRLRAKMLAQAGIRYANEQLERSALGADWRPPVPDAVNPDAPSFDANAHNLYFDEFERLRGWDNLSEQSRASSQGRAPVYFAKFPNPLRGGAEDLRLGDGYFLLKVEYAPLPGNPLSKFLKITSIGRPTDDLFVYDMQVAYKPLGLTDYAWFITDKTHNPAPAVLGLPWIDINGNGIPEAGAEDFIFSLSGPVRANKSLVWDTPVNITLYPTSRGDRIEVAGSITHRVIPSPTAGQQAMGYLPGDVMDANLAVVNLVDADSGSTATVVPSGDPNFTTLKGVYRDHAPGSGDPVRTVARLEAPDLEVIDPATGVSRYEALTRFSGTDRGSYNTGEFGFGAGIYIDNFSERDPENVRSEWLDPSGWNGRAYTPRGVEIVLFPTNMGETRVPNDPTRPDLQILRNDRPWDRGPDGSPITPTRDLYFDYPANGVILAEGNIRIRGILPPGLGGLTVVSRGSIYIEGSILRPSDVPGSGVPVNDPANTRIALLARENIVINPTRLCVQDAPFLPGGGWTFDAEDSHWTLNPQGTQAEFLVFNFSRPLRGTVYLTVKHADNQSSGPDDDGLPALAEYQVFTDPLLTNNTWTLSIDAPGTPPAKQVPGYEALGLPVGVPYPDYDQLYGGTLYRPDSWAISSSAFNLNGRDNFVRLASAAGSSASQSVLRLTNAKIEQLDGSGQPLAGLDLVISALLYAERGSLFVIPGQFFDEDDSIRNADLNGDGSISTIEWVRFARFRRYNYAITVNGAIAVNDTPPLGDVGEWSDKWSYPAGWSGGIPAWGQITFNFDDGLMANRAPNLPRLPALPVSSELIALREH